MPNAPLKILITNQKGGVGKGTLSANLAGYLAIEKQLSVALIDFDKQGTSSNFTNKRTHEKYPNL
jgi:cellulose biosynthesis protein BcsQ